MSRAIAISGKGGTGKTTIAALVINHLILRDEKPILAVDADPNSNLNILLGVELSSTIGSTRESFSEMIKRGEVPAGMPKQDLLEMQIEQVLVEGDDFDLLAMGRGEGPGCYCAVNNMLRTFLDRISKDYKYIVVDNEAGMEHLSRRTTIGVDEMLIISDPSPRGIYTAQRIKKLAEEMKLEVRAFHLVISRMVGEFSDDLKSAVSSTGMELAGIVPYDPEISRRDAAGEPLLGMSPEFPAQKAVGKILDDVLCGVSKKNVS